MPPSDLGGKPQRERDTLLQIQKLASALTTEANPYRYRENYTNKFHNLIIFHKSHQDVVK